MLPNVMRDGFRYLGGAFAADEIAALTVILDAVPSAAAGRRWAGEELIELMAHPAMTVVKRKLASLASGHAVLRVVAFQKDAKANWSVPAHQDRSIPLRSGAPLPADFINATRKGDSWQAEAPVRVLEKMRNFRIFIDAATDADGPLEIIPGSHRLGRIAQELIPGIVGNAKWLPLTGRSGDVVALSPLLLHRSMKAVRPRGRRVLQLECIAAETAEAFALPAVSF